MRSKHILLGYSARQIGEKIKISTKTVESYIETIRLKLQAKNKGEIIASAIQFGLTHILYLQTHDVINVILCNFISNSAGIT